MERQQDPASDAGSVANQAGATPAAAPGQQQSATPPKKPVQGPQLPIDCGPAHRLRPDIAAALLWGPRGADARTADHLIDYIGRDELVTVIDTAWLSQHGWGLLAVTSQRVLYLANNDTEGALALPIEAVLWLSDGNEDNQHGHRKGSLIDLERNIVMWFEGLRSIQAINYAIGCSLRIHTNIQPGYDKADTGGVLEQFTRFAALRKAQEAGALDDESMRQAVTRLFGLPPQSESDEQPPPHDN